MRSRRDCDERWRELGWQGARPPLCHDTLSTPWQKNSRRTRGDLRPFPTSAFEVNRYGQPSGSTHNGVSPLIVFRRPTLPQATGHRSATSRPHHSLDCYSERGLRRVYHSLGVGKRSAVKVF